MSKEQCLR